MRAIGLDLVALVDQILFPELLEDPPDRFDIVVGIGDIGILEIDPEADAAGDLIPFLQIGPDALTAFGIELVNAVGDDLVLALEAELLFDLDLDRQAVGIPAGLAFDAVALHGAQAADGVLDGAGDDMVNAGPSIGGRGAFEKDEGFVFVAFGDAALENMVLVPPGQNCFFDLGKIEFFR